jgi:ABC-type transporter Mla subunit MlaD
MADDYDDRFRQHEAIMAGLARILDAQHARNERLDAWMARQDTLNERLTVAIERIDRTLAAQAVVQGDVRTTLARLETIIARLGQQGENGRNA